MKRAFVHEGEVCFLFISLAEDGVVTASSAAGGSPAGWHKGEQSGDRERKNRDVQLSYVSTYCSFSIFKGQEEVEELTQFLCFLSTLQTVYNRPKTRQGIDAELTEGLLIITFLLPTEKSFLVFRTFFSL